MLKFLILVLVAGVLHVNGAPAAENSVVHVKRSVDHLQRLVGLNVPPIHDQATISRTKRQVDLDDDDSYEDSTSCILRCVNQLKLATERMQTTISFNSQQSMTKPNVNFTVLKEYCTITSPSIHCFQGCPESTLKTTISRTLEPIKYICIDRFQDIQNNFRCMSKLQSTSQAQCGPQCRRYEAAANQTMELAARPYLKYLKTVSELRQILSGTCQYVECHTDCSAELARGACGDTAGELITVITQKLFVSLQATADVSNVDLPEACARLANPNRTNQRRIVIDEPRQDEDSDFNTNRRNDNVAVILVVPAGSEEEAR